MSVQAYSGDCLCVNTDDFRPGSDLDLGARRCGGREVNMGGRRMRDLESRCAEVEKFLRVGGVKKKSMLQVQGIGRLDWTELNVKTRETKFKCVFALIVQ